MTEEPPATPGHREAPGTLVTPPPPPPPRVARTLMVIDPAGSAAMTAEQEHELIAADFAERGVLIDYRVVETFDEHDAGDPEPIVFDWGGMAMDNHLLETQSRALIRYAEDHPFTLMALRSLLGKHYIDGEMAAERLPKLPNVLNDAGIGVKLAKLPPWWVNNLRRNPAAKTS